jgi:hypothetical protein
MPNPGHLTPSNFGKVLTIANYQKCLKDPKEITKLSETAKKYAVSVVRSGLGVESKELNLYAFEHGKKWEPVARQEFGKETFLAVDVPDEEERRIFHPKYDFICGEPDGFIGSDALIEIKCPENPDNHLNNLLTGAQVDDYYAQIQGYLWITGRQLCYFTSFHPDPNWGNRRLYIQEVKRNETYIEVLEKRLLCLWEYVGEINAKLLSI